jgi:hypothetical protein
MGWYLRMQPPRAFASARCTDEAIATFNKTSNPCDEDSCTTLCLDAVETQLWLEIGGVSATGVITLLLMALHCYRFLHHVSPYLAIDDSNDSSETEDIDVNLLERNPTVCPISDSIVDDDDSDDSDKEDEANTVDLVPIPQVRRRLLHSIGKER